MKRLLATTALCGLFFFVPDALATTYTGVVQLTGYNTLVLNTYADAAGITRIELSDRENGIQFGSSFDLDKDLVLLDANDFSFDTDYDATYSGDISNGGAPGGSLTKLGTGRLLLTGHNTFTDGGDPYNYGLVFIVEGSVAGDETSIPGFVTILSQLQGGTGFLELTGDYNGRIQSGAIYGDTDGGVLVDGNTVHVTGSANYVGSTRLRNGANYIYTVGRTLQSSSLIDVDGTSTFTFGNNVGLVAPMQLATGATLHTDFNPAQVAGISGGAWNKTGTGTLTLIKPDNALNTYTGVNLNAGGLKGNSNALIGNIAMAAGTTIQFNQIEGAGNPLVAFNGTMLATLTGTNTHLIKSGIGQLIIDDGVSGWSGDTTINGGRLDLLTTLTSDVTINDTGELGGNGTITGDVTVNDGGTVFAGYDALEGLTVGGDVNFASGSSLNARYIPGGYNDFLDVSGDVTIDSDATLNLFGFNGAFDPNDVYTLIYGNSITGTFDTITNTLAFLDATQTNTGTSLNIRFTRNATDFSEVAANPTQMQTANALNDLGSGNDLFDAFIGITNAEASNALQSISGSSVVGAIPNISSSFTSPVMAHIAATSGAMQTANANTDPSIYTSAYLEPSDNIDYWLQMIGGVGHTLGDSNSPSQKRGNYGTVAGVDRNFDNAQGRFGLFGGWQLSDFHSDSVGSSSDVNSWQLGAYIQHPLANGFTITGGAAAMVHDIDTVRHVIVGGNDFSPHGDTMGNTMTAFGEVSHAITPGFEGFTNLSITRNHTNGYSETEGGAANLTIGDVTKTNPATTIGVRGGKQLGIINLSGSLGWQHTFGDVDNDADMRFAGGTTTFTSTGTPIARDSGVMNLKVTTPIKSGINGYAGYDGTLSPEAQDHSFSLGIKAAF